MVSQYAHDANTGKESFAGRVVAEVYTLGTGSWRHIGPAPFSICKLAFPTFLNGAIHWFCIDPNCSDSIVSFDIDNERLQSFPPPSHRCRLISWWEGWNRRDLSMGVLGGCLCICDASSWPSINVWIMKDYGVKESWTKVFSIASLNISGLFQPIKYMNDGALLMFHYSRCALIYYDPRKLGFKYFKFRGVKSKFEVIAHTTSFISLKDALLGDDVPVLTISSRCAELKLPGESRPLSLVVGNRNMEVESESSDEESEKWDRHWWQRRR